MSIGASLLILAVCAFLQNMAFTWASRSRNSGDPNYHRYAAWASNGTWFVTFFFVLKTIWPALMADDWWTIIATTVVYVVFTTEGSVVMMRILLKKERGKRKVGATVKESYADWGAGTEAKDRALELKMLELMENKSHDESLATAISAGILVKTDSGYELAPRYRS